VRASNVPRVRDAKRERLGVHRDGAKVLRGISDAHRSCRSRKEQSEKERVMNAKVTTVLTAAAVIVSTTQARAQNDQPEAEGGFWLGQHVNAPDGALELTIGTGYTQGFGSLQSGVNMHDVITPGFAVEGGIGYRFSPNWSLEVTGQYQEFDAQRTEHARGFLPGIAGTFHFMPYRRTDPYVSLGTGYRMLWEDDPMTHRTLLTHGFELARLSVGVDFRMTEDISVAPVVGADLTLPLWQDANNGTGNASINDPRVSTFVFAGLQGRFDLGGRRESGRPPVAPPHVTQAQVAPPPPVQEETKPVTPAIGASEELLNACKEQIDNISKAPKFKTNQADFSPDDVDVLHAIAECMTTGPLKDAKIRLVGRADPRGTKKHNMELGMRRANNTAEVLQEFGVDAGRNERVSRGESDATGKNEAGWKQDRRVDIVLSH
jgi:outer membrane protein OmpA-like peptidoglycan-associated protein